MCVSVREGVCLTVLVFQITTVGTTAMKQAVATPAPVLSLSVTAAAAYPTTGPVTETMTVVTTVMRLMPTAPIRVSVSSVVRLSGRVSYSYEEKCSFLNPLRCTIKPS